MFAQRWRSGRSGRLVTPSACNREPRELSGLKCRSREVAATGAAPDGETSKIAGEDRRLADRLSLKDGPVGVVFEGGRRCRGITNGDGLLVACGLRPCPTGSERDAESNYRGGECEWSRDPWHGSPTY